MVTGKGDQTACSAGCGASRSLALAPSSMEKPQVLMEVWYVRRRCPFLPSPPRFSLLHCPFSSLGEWASEEAAAPQQEGGGPRKARGRACRHQQAARSPRAREAWARSRGSPPPRPRPGPAAPWGRAEREALRGDLAQGPGPARAERAALVGRGHIAGGEVGTAPRRA